MSDLCRPFDAIREALGWTLSPNGVDEPEPAIRFDPGRAERTGVPEIILAEHKSIAEVISALDRQTALTGRAIASRCPAATLAAIPPALGGSYQVELHSAARTVVVAEPDSHVTLTGGRIAIFSAGTSDRAIAAEAAVIAREMGVVVEEVFDVGVAGLHRLVAPLERVMASGVDAIVVAAGMDGALPSVIAGLVAVPVIGLPTSVGYGFGGQGTGALTAMLQSCAPGLAVVNIDNGIGAGATAALIANRVALARANAASAPGLQERPDQGLYGGT